MNFDILKLVIQSGIQAGHLNLQEYGAGPVQTNDGESFYFDLNDCAGKLYGQIKDDYKEEALSIYCAAYSLACEGAV